jgi:preprotein translocase subunit YajC
MSFVPFLQAAGSAGQGNLLMTMGPFVLIALIFYMFMIRPQNKKQKEMERMLSELKKGDKVVTIGGIHGTVSSTKDKTVIVKVDDETKIEFNRTAISTLVSDKPAAAPVPATAEKPKFSLAGLFGKKSESAPESAPATSEASDPTAPNS